MSSIEDRIAAAFPTHAGMNRQRDPQGSAAASVPHTHGDEPSRIFFSERERWLALQWFEIGRSATQSDISPDRYKQDLFAEWAIPNPVQTEEAK